jgi:heme exporter protein A
MLNKPFMKPIKEKFFKMSSVYFTYDIKRPDISVKRLSFSMDNQPKAKQVVRLTGSNGSGKTTLLQILSGLIVPDTGQSPYDEGSFFYLPHHAGLRGDLTVAQNLDYWAAIMHIQVKQHVKKLADVIDAFELKDFMDIPVKHLSAGQQRRAALLRLSLVRDRDIWFLDEPESNLDQAMTIRLGQIVADYAAQGGAVIWATHLDKYAFPIAIQTESQRDMILPEIAL